MRPILIKDFFHLSREGSDKLIDYINEKSSLAIEGMKSLPNGAKAKGLAASRYGCYKCADRFHSNKGNACSTNFGISYPSWMDAEGGPTRENQNSTSGKAGPVTGRPTDAEGMKPVEALKIVDM
jgi:hypothetical protein